MKKELKTKKLPPIHPGEILRERLLIPRDISPQELAVALKVPNKMSLWGKSRYYPWFSGPISLIFW